MADEPVYSVLTGKFPSSYTVSNSLEPVFDGVYTLQGIKSVGSSGADTHPYYKLNSGNVWIFYEFEGLQWIATEAPSWQYILDEWADGSGSLPGQTMNFTGCPACPTVPLTGWIFDIS
jgi:hypothetical protein